MHIAIYGVGAIGGFYGSLLADYINSPIHKKQHHKISFVARGENLKAIQENGLTLIKDKGSDEEEILNQEVDIYENFQDLKNVDAVLLCVKCKDTISAAEDIKNNLNENSYVVSIQNGIDNEEKLSVVLGSNRVIACLTNIAAQNEEAGVYSQTGNYNILLGELDNSNSPRINELCDLFKSAEINAQITQTIQKDLWSKLVWNAAFNPISALHKATIGELYDKQEYMDIIRGIMNEVVKVSELEGIKLAPELTDNHIKRTSAPEWRSFKTSMLQDTLAGKNIELEELLGIVIKKAQTHGINTPNALLIYNSLLK